MKKINEDKSIKIIVAAHKKYRMPTEAMYLPLHVGAEGKTDAAGNPIDLGFQKDNEGENISGRNNRYCELTGLYWAWKNLSADYIGLAHYRRHFAGSGECGVMNAEEARSLLTKAPVILPKKRRYYIETIRSHYGNTFDSAHLEILREALERLSPEYLPAFDRQMKSTGAHMFNMFVMRADLLDAYCSWLFPVLEEAEAHISFENMSGFESRCMGRLSERLLDVWLNTNKISYTERRLVNMEPVNWFKKGSAFLAAKFFGKRYKASF